MAAEDGQDVRVFFRPQVVVDFADGRRKSFLLSDLTDGEALKEGEHFRLYADSDEQQAALIGALERLGIHPVWKGVIPMPPSEDGQAQVKVNAVYDDVVRRLIGKIAFNYLATIVGASFSLKEEFDPIRTFVRYGRGHGPDFVQPSNIPLLHEERRSGECQLRKTIWSPSTEAWLVGFWVM